VKYLSIDIETTGLRRGRDQILEVAAILADTRSAEPVDNLPAFHARLYYDEIVGQPYALHMNAKMVLDVANRPNCYQWCAPDSLAGLLHDWITRASGWDQKNKVTLAGKNAGTFDLPFLQALPNWDRYMGDRVHHRVIDPSAYYWHQESDDVLPDTKTCITRAGIAWDHSRLHTAREDAMLVVELVRRGPIYLHQHYEDCVEHIAELAKEIKP
jgi:hypothetical protein